MKIILDGQGVENLDPKIAREIGPWADTPVAEGVILAADPVIAETARRTKIGLWVLGGVVAAVLFAAAVITLNYEPADIAVIGPLYLAILAGMGIGGRALLRRSTAKLGQSLTRRAARMAPPGTAIHLDATGLTIAGQLTPWRNIALDAMEIVTDHNPDSADGHHIEAIMLAVAGRNVVLDRGLITNGVRILDKILLTLSADLN